MNDSVDDDTTNLIPILGKPETVWKLRKFTFTIISKEFREINILNYTVSCFHEKKFHGRASFSFFHTVPEKTPLWVLFAMQFPDVALFFACFLTIPEN